MGAARAGRVLTSSAQSRAVEAGTEVGPIVNAMLKRQRNSEEYRGIKEQRPIQSFQGLGGQKAAEG